jgi:hypothetical protein
MQQQSSHLFTLRVWSEVEEDGVTRWRGKLCHVPSGDIRHFRGWAALVPLLLDILRHQPEAPHDLSLDSSTNQTF